MEFELHAIKFDESIIIDSFHVVWTIFIIGVGLILNLEMTLQLIIPNLNPNKIILPNTHNISIRVVPQSLIHQQQFLVGVLVEVGLR